MQLKLPRKLVCTVQLWVSVVLIILAMIFSLTPIITLNTNDGAGADILDFIENEMDLDIGRYDFDEDGLEISAPKLIGSISLLVDVISAASDSDSDSAQALQERLDTDEGKEDILTIAGIAMTFMNTFDFDNMPEDPFRIIFECALSIIALIYVIIMVLVFPIMLIVAAIVTVIKALKNIKTPENVSADIGNKLSPMLSMSLMFMLFQCAIKDGLMAPGSGLYTVLILAIVSVAINFVVTRLREYPSEQFKYINIVQPVAIVSIIGFLVFFFNLIETGILNSFVGGGFRSGLLAAVADENYASMIMILVYLLFAIASVGYLDKAARRLSCTVKREGPKGLVGIFVKGNVSDNNIVHSVSTLLVYILPAIVIGMDYLKLTDDQSGALTGVLVGSIIMVISDIAAIVLKKVFCKNLSEEDAEALLTGKAKTTEERLEEAQKIIAENEAKLAEAQAKLDSNN